MELVLNVPESLINVLEDAVVIGIGGHILLEFCHERIVLDFHVGLALIRNTGHLDVEDGELVQSLAQANGENDFC